MMAQGKGPEFLPVRHRVVVCLLGGPGEITDPPKVVTRVLNRPQMPVLVRYVVPERPPGGKPTPPGFPDDVQHAVSLLRKPVLRLIRGGCSD